MDIDTGTHVAIELLDGTTSGDGGLVDLLAGLINEVYGVAETGLWHDGMARTSSDELARLIAAGEIAVAKAEDDQIVGSIHVHQIAEDTNEFGMLVALPARRGMGIGRALVGFAEHLSREQGRRAIQLELLVPRLWRHPTKEFLSSWYGRIGYQIIRIANLDERYPHLAPFLATPCDLQVREKTLLTVSVESRPTRRRV